MLPQPQKLVGFTVSVKFPSSGGAPWFKQMFFHLQGITADITGIIWWSWLWISRPHAVSCGCCKTRVGKYTALKQLLLRRYTLHTPEKGCLLRWSSDLCFFHQRFSHKARHCVPPVCSRCWETLTQEELLFDPLNGRRTLPLRWASSLSPHQIWTRHPKVTAQKLGAANRSTIGASDTRMATVSFYEHSLDCDSLIEIPIIGADFLCANG